MSVNLFTSWANADTPLFVYSKDLLPILSTSAVNVASLNVLGSETIGNNLLVGNALNVMSTLTAPNMYMSSINLPSAPGGVVQQNPVALPATRLLTTQDGAAALQSVPLVIGGNYALDYNAEYDITVKGTITPGTVPGTPAATDIVYTNVALGSGANSSPYAVAQKWFLPSAGAAVANNCDNPGTTATGTLYWTLKDRLYVPSNIGNLFSTPRLSLSVPSGQTASSYGGYVQEWTINRVK